MIQSSPTESTAEASVAAFAALQSLTLQEWRILRLVSENKTSRAIGEELNISYRTAQKHRANICDKLSLHGSNKLLEFVLRHRNEIDWTDRRE